MKAELEIDAINPGRLREILRPSIESRDKVNLEVEASDVLEVYIQTEGLGPLRGTTDNVFRLTSLAKKIYET